MYSQTYLEAANTAASSSLKPGYFLTSRTNFTRVAVSSFPSLKKLCSSASFSSET